MKLIITLCLVMMSMTHAALGQRGNPLTKLGDETPDEMIAEFMREHRVPGMTLAIVQAPYVSRVVGYGEADVSRHLLSSPNTLWAIGEMTQAFTAVAVMQLVEAGKLTVDGRLGDVVAGLPQEWQSLTLRQLLGHASGLPDYTAQPSFDATKEYKPEEIIGLVKGLPLVFKPGTRVARSATNFFLLGLVIEKASGMSYEEFITKGQIERLGLRQTLFPSALGQRSYEHTQFLSDPAYINPSEPATGYVQSNGALTPAPRSSQRALFANGAILASAPDISAWDIGLAGGILVKDPANRAIIYSAFKLADGSSYPANCGWRFNGHKGFMDISGNAPGYSVYLSRFTDKSELVCVTLCANKGNLDLTELARRVAGCFDARLAPPSGGAGMKCMESSFPVNITMDRLETFLKAQGTSIVARVDHAGAAKHAGLDLRPTQTLIFGNPAVGTHVMSGNQAAAIDLPLRMAAWLDERGSVWLGWNEPATLATQNESASTADGTAEALARMKSLLNAAAKQATSPYP